MTWDLPVPIKVVRDRALKQDKGDRAFVELLLMAGTLGDNGLDALEVACDLTLQTGIVSSAIVQPAEAGHAGSLARQADCRRTNRSASPQPE
ncbi:hypothetical protein RP726_12060 [Candidatus Methylospira mobilis]|uniref:hypothetical protein n=1 Tax=Candidatus Methylospira mobilis TaxID=1808979 RepID=UPI0028EC2285|nr:hypothetical protein [Candidatus Methylospira mobilis]WNV03203.1 hypothetical protein RP726_12060 [Candidatus Methylospira mobilis]